MLSMGLCQKGTASTKFLIDLPVGFIVLLDEQTNRLHDDMPV